MSAEKKVTWTLGASALGMAVLVAAWFLLPVGDWLKEFSGWADDQGFVGVLVLSAAYFVGTLMLVPGFPMTLALAFAYGWWAGMISFTAGLLSAVVAFVLARSVARAPVERFIRKRRWFKAFDAAISDETFKAVLLSRLSPVTPFAIANYAFGLTGVKFAPYLAATAVGVIPGTVLNVWIGLLGRTASQGNADLLTWASMILGLVATVVLCAWLTRRAKAQMVARGA